MNSIEFLAIRKLQKEYEQSDYEITLFLEAVDAGDSTQEATLEVAMVEVADDSYRPEGYPTPPVQEVASRPNGESDLHVKDGWLYSGNQKVPSFTPARATLSGDTGCFVAMTDEGQVIFAWHDHDRSTCNCQHTNIETYLPDKIPPIELAPSAITAPSKIGQMRDPDRPISL